MYFNHGASTSLDKDSFICIWDTINYMFLHGFNKDDFAYYQLKDEQIKYYFSIGLKNVKQDVLLIQKIWKQLKRKKLPINNDRYSSILYEQIPHLGSFNQTCSLNDELYNEFDSSIEWQKHFIAFLKKCITSQKKEIEYALHHIKIVQEMPSI